METQRAITEAQIDAWKKKHGEIQEITVAKDGEKYKAIVRKPTLDDILMSEELAKDDTIKQNLFLFKNCHLGGDSEFNTDDELRFAASNEVAKLFRFLKATTKKL